jgi:uncharacterized protein (DUF1800 family)
MLPINKSAGQIQKETRSKYLKSIMNIHKYLIVLTSYTWLLLANSVQAESVNPKIIHLLNRLSLGISPGDIEQVQKIGVDKYIQQQLDPNSIPESPILGRKLSKLDTIELSPLQIFQRYNYSLPILDIQGPVDKKSQRQQQVKQQQYQSQQSIIIKNQAIDAKIWKSIYSNRQLNEVMVDFWYNHFNVYAEKGLTSRLLVGAYERQAIRPYAMGNFRDLLGATARHPGMLFYLDNWQSSAANPNKKGKMQGLNENYARELIELHTLGVDGGYQQDDVIALAKILTGWSFKQPDAKELDSYSFKFNSNRHDFTDKTFLGKTIIGSGIGEGEQALDLLSRHPSTARQISFELAQYFVSDKPPKSLIDKLAKRFIATDGDIKLVLNTLFHSPEFWDAKYYGAKFKTPYQYAVSSVRSTGVDINSLNPLYDLLKQLDMPIYHCPTPNGYDNSRDAWLNPDGMYRRINYANEFANKVPTKISTVTPASTLPTKPSTVTPASTLPAKPPTVAPASTLPAKPPTVAPASTLPAKPSTVIPASTLPTKQITTIDPIKLAITLGNNFSDRTQQALAASSPEIRAALILGSPDFMKK